MPAKRPQQLVLYIEPEFARLVEIQASRDNKSVSRYLRLIVLKHLDEIGLTSRELLQRAIR
jgi:hypothetical protein